MWNEWMDWNELKWKWVLRQDVKEWKWKYIYIKTTTSTEQQQSTKKRPTKEIIKNKMESVYKKNEISKWL